MFTYFVNKRTDRTG